MLNFRKYLQRWSSPKPSDDIDLTDNHNSPASTVVFHNYVFDTGGAVDVRAALSAMLESDLATAGAVFSEQGIEPYVATRYKRLTKLANEARFVGRISDALNTDTRGIFSYCAKHPLDAVRWIVMAVRARRRRHDDEISNPGDGNPTVDTQEMMRDTLAFLNDQMAKTMGLPVLLTQLDDEMIRRDLLVRGFVARIALQPIHGTTGDDTQSIDVDLVIHESGIAVVTFAVMHDPKHDIRQVTHMSHGDMLRFTSTRLPSVLFSPLVKSRDFLQPVSRTKEDIEWYEHQLPDGVALSDIFPLYLQHVTDRLASARSSSLNRHLRSADAWSAYPLLSIRTPTPDWTSHKKGRHPTVGRSSILGIKTQRCMATKAFLLLLNSQRRPHERIPRRLCLSRTFDCSDSTCANDGGRPSSTGASWPFFRKVR